MANIAFIESTIGIPLSIGDRTYLTEKTEFYTSHRNSTDPFNFLGRQIGHIALLPYKVVCLALQTITDLFILAVHTALAPVLLLFGRTGIKEIEKDIACRSYNLLVADAFVWVTVIPSLLSAHFFNEAGTYHLGTLRGILS
jgi:hypothetical protein